MGGGGGSVQKLFIFIVIGQLHDFWRGYSLIVARVALSLHKVRSAYKFIS